MYGDFMNEFFKTISNVLGDLGTYAHDLIEAIKTIYDLIKTIMSFIPSPFSDILLIALSLLLTIMLYKLLKGLI